MMRVTADCKRQVPEILLILSWRYSHRPGHLR